MRLFPVVLLAAYSYAQVQPGQPAEAPKRARIEGTVVSVAGPPVPRATVRLTSPTRVENGVPTQGSAYSATTGDDGKFVIEDIDPGRNFQLIAQRTGFVNGRYGARSASTSAAPLSLEAGASLKGLTITMIPQGVVSGKITDPAGDPVQGVLVSLMRRGYQRGNRQLLPMNTNTTNDQGEFRLSGLPPGRYYLMASSRSLADGLAVGGGASAGTSPIPTYYPNGTDPQSAAPLDIAAGQEVRNVDIRLRQGKTYSIRGKFLDAGGAPVANAMLLTLPKAAGSDPISQLTLRSQVNTRADGSFDIRGLTPGLYAMQAISTQSGATRALGRTEVNIADADITNLVFTATPGARVTGVVRLEDGDLKSLMPAASANTQPNASALVLAANTAGIVVSSSRMVVGLTESTPQPIASAQPAQVNEDGTFTIENVAPSKFMLNVAALPQGTYVKSARFGGADAMRSEIDLTSGAGGNLEILLSKKAADVAGTVTPQKDESVAGTLVTLWTRDPEPGVPSNGVRTAVADQSGNFQFQGLHPGTYYAAAWEDIDSGLAQARDFLNLMTGDAAKLEIAEGAHSSAQVKVIPLAKIKTAEEKLP